MINNDIYSYINYAMRSKGLNPIVGTIYDQIAIWKQWYRGCVNDFHYYNVKLVNGTTGTRERLTMSMAKKICEDYSRLLWTEKVKIILDTEDKTERLWNVLESPENNFAVNFPKLLEKAFALGTGMLVEYKDNDETKIDYIDADLIIPLSASNSNITSVITMNRWSTGTNNNNLYYTHLTIHEFDGRIYRITNELYISSYITQLGNEVNFSDAFPHVDVVTEYETDTPHFQIITPNIANNFDFTSPMGISIYGNHLDKLKALDIKYDSLNKEIINGKKRIVVDRTALKHSVDIKNGQATSISYFDANDDTYVAINGSVDKEMPVKAIDSSLRVQEHITAINADLNYLGAGVGLGNHFYSFEKLSARTATEVVSANSDTFRSKQNMWNIIRVVIENMVKSICFLEGIDVQHITIIPDDSVIEDNDADMRRALVEYNTGIIDAVEYFVKAYGYSEEEAIKMVERINERKRQAGQLDGHYIPPVYEL